ncbi:MAG: putative selenium-dependent hydroxylase accessory protein YqeC, partial [Parasporobacterium sp.]|nr:putative selenium-dependent hydroxylase accessory protein YqeC [Parasporobacterium sp.]
MIRAYVGAGGKTTAIRKDAQRYRQQGLKVLVTTTTHMLIEENTLVSDDPDEIIRALEQQGYVMAGTLESYEAAAGEKTFAGDDTGDDEELAVGGITNVGDGALSDNSALFSSKTLAGIKKIKALSRDTYLKVCEKADVVLIEADGSGGMPLKYPNENEPVIYDNVEEIVVVVGLNSIGRPASEVCHRLHQVMDCAEISADTIITAEHVQKIIREGYIHRFVNCNNGISESLCRKTGDQFYMSINNNYELSNLVGTDRNTGMKISVLPTHTDSLYKKIIAALLAADADVSMIREQWFAEKPVLFICGGGYVSRELAYFAAKLDFSVTVYDDRPEFASPEYFPEGTDIICGSFDNLSEHLKEGSFYVVVTRGHMEDYSCVKAILNT